jgi:probable HAF family extracellular repeat protein
LTTSTAKAVNAVGQIVSSTLMSDTSYHGYVWQNGVFTDLGPGSANGINRSGWIAGTLLANGLNRPTLWRPNQRPR